MESALYYTFSTVAQSLAGILGLLAAFIALRLSEFNGVIYSRMMESFSRNKTTTYGKPLSGPFGRGDAKAFFDEYRAQLNQSREQGAVPTPEDEALMANGCILVARKGRFSTHGRHAIVFNIAIVGCCFIVLMHVPLVPRCGAVPYLLLAVGALSGAVGVALAGRLIRESLNEA